MARASKDAKSAAPETPDRARRLRRESLILLLAPVLADPRLVVRAVAVGVMVVGGLVAFIVFCQLTGAADFLGAFAKVRRRA